MKVITVKAGQNIIDIALTYYGDVAGMFLLFDLNAGLNINSTLAAGQILKINESLIINTEVVRYFQQLGTEVNTGDEDKREGIGYWHVNQDNIVQ